MSDDDHFEIFCGRCGRSAPFQSWRTTRMSGELPPNQFQCPNCGFAFKRQRNKNYTKPWQKFIELVPIQGRL